MEGSSSSSLPWFVGGRIWIGNEVHAASLKSLRELDITHIVNVGFPQCINHFEDYPGFHYCTVELFDNAAPNLCSVFLHQIFPFVCAAVNQNRGVLIHCKTGRSKSPAVMVAYMMLRHGMSVAPCFPFLPSTVRVSDALLGELLLLQDAAQDDAASGVRVPLPDSWTQTSLSYTICDAHEEDLVNSMKQLVLSGSSIDRIASNSDSGILLRQAIWDSAPKLLDVQVVLKDPVKFSQSLSSLRSRLITLDCFHALQSALSAPQGTAKALAMYLNSNLSTASARGVLQSLQFFWQVCQDFCHEYEALTRGRLLAGFNGDSINMDHESEVLHELAVWPKLSRLVAHCQLMLNEVTTVRKMQEAGRGVVLNRYLWNLEESTVQLPESLAALHKQLVDTASQDSKKVVSMQAELGTVELWLSQFSVTLTVPTDMFIVLQCFEHHTNLSRDDLLAMSGARRLDAILAALVKNVPRTKSSLLLLDAATNMYRLNDGFESKLKRLAISF